MARQLVRELGGGGWRYQEETSVAPEPLPDWWTITDAPNLALFEGSLTIKPQASDVDGLVVKASTDQSILNVGDYYGGTWVTISASRDFAITEDLDVGSPVFKARAGSGTGLLGFFGTAPVAKPTGVAVSAAGVHAALVSLGLIGA